MVRTNPDDPAFSQSHGIDIIRTSSGLTKREYFAGEAMRGMMSCDHRDLVAAADQKFATVGEWIASNCIAMADFLIAELNNEVKP